MNPSAGISIAVLAAVLVCDSAGTRGQQMKQIADPGFDAKVANPAFTEEHPRVLFDEAHHNRHTTAGSYKPFVDLIVNDGYRVTSNKQTFTDQQLSTAAILVIANATTEEGRPNAKHAFTEEECDAVREWVRGGGALLLIADHSPYGSAAENLASRFGVDMRDGYTFDPAHCDRRAYWQLIFSRDNSLLADHPIIKGRDQRELVQRVMTFGGQSLQGPGGSTALLKLADTAVDRPSFQSQQEVSAAGRAQAVALRFGKGRVVALGEAAMLSAQVLWIRGVGTQSPMGMNVAGTDNRQLTLNIMHWFSGLLD